MDYKYISQLLDRYWRCETTLEEESILRAFFSQDDVPAELRPYRDLFRYERTEPETDVLGDAFDEKLLALVSDPEPVKARIVTLPRRLRPLGKAAAIVAVILTLGNALQVPLHERQQTNPVRGYDGYGSVEMLKTSSVAIDDSTSTDTLRPSMTGRSGMSPASFVK